MAVVIILSDYPDTVNSVPWPAPLGVEGELTTIPRVEVLVMDGVRLVWPVGFCIEK